MLRAQSLASYGVHRHVAMFVRLAIVAASLVDPWEAGAEVRYTTQTTSLGTLRVREGFDVELVYAVPEELGSWVSMTSDPQGRLIVSDQNGKLYRLHLPSPVQVAPDDQRELTVEPIDLPIGHAHGLLYAFESLYAVVGDRQYEGPGLYRIRDTDQEDQFDEVALLCRLEGKGEHGPHAVVRAPDGESLLVIAGNHTMLPELTSSRVPQVWGEEELLPRLWGPLGSEAGTPAPGGWICRVDPHGKHWELVAVGLRNGFDLAVNEQGELFTADADAEFDMNTPWYQATRVFHVVSGVDFGWRSGAGKWPPYYPETVDPVVDLGPGSPTGLTFGYGSGFPPRYQQALFVGDWSYGNLYAMHMVPDGTGYRSDGMEKFLSGTPLPIADLLIHPIDQALYFVTGGRKTSSGLFRVRYTGTPSAPSETRTGRTGEAELRRRLESLHLEEDPERLTTAWPALGHPDRLVRHAARVVLEHEPAGRWAERALQEADGRRQLTALLALARVGRSDHSARLFAELDDFDWAKLTIDERLELLRIYELGMIRLARPTGLVRDRMSSRLSKLFPTGSRPLDAKLCELLVALDVENVVPAAVQQVTAAVTQQEQLELAVPLRLARVGWTPRSWEEYFRWLSQARRHRGGAAYQRYLTAIQDAAVASLSDAEKRSLEEFLREDTEPVPSENSQRPLVRKWAMEDLLPGLDQKLNDRDVGRGRHLFGQAQCFACHRYSGEGGAVGPDLTGVAARFSAKDLLESILVPDKAISDQYAAVTIMKTNGQVVSGRIVNLVGQGYLLQTDMFDPGKLTRVERNDIETMTASPVSLMPTGLLDTFKEDEILDVLAYLLSRGQ